MKLQIWCAVRPEVEVCTPNATLQLELCGIKCLGWICRILWHPAASCGLREEYHQYHLNDVESHGLLAEIHWFHSLDICVFLQFFWLVLMCLIVIDGHRWLLIADSWCGDPWSWRDWETRRLWQLTHWRTECFLICCRRRATTWTSRSLHQTWGQLSQLKCFGGWNPLISSRHCFQGSCKTTWASSRFPHSRFVAAICAVVQRMVAWLHCCLGQDVSGHPWYPLIKW